MVAGGMEQEEERRPSQHGREHDDELMERQDELVQEEEHQVEVRRHQVGLPLPVVLEGLRMAKQQRREKEIYPGLDTIAGKQQSNFTVYRNYA